MRARAAVLCLLLLAPVAATAAPQRIVSLNLCADILLVALVEPARIAALTRQAADPLMSPVAEIAAGLPQVSRNAEQVLAFGPDLVVASRYAAGPTKALLARLAVPVHEVDVAASFDGMLAELRALGRAVGEPARAEALVAQLSARLASVSRALGPGAATALPYGPRGGTAGRGAFLDDVITHAGLRNLARELGFGAFGTLPLEAALRLRPDFLVIEGHADARGSIGRDLVRHPALAGIARVVLPGPWLTCPGPASLAAVARLAAAAREAAP